MWTDHTRPTRPSMPPPQFATTQPGAFRNAAPAPKGGGGPVSSLREVVSFDSANVFAGRISRSAIAWWILAVFIVRIVLATVTYAMPDGAVSLASGLLSLGMTVLTVSAWVRRLHDIGKSGKNLFWFLVPLAGAVYLIVLASRRGDSGANAYGPAPR